LLALLNKHKAVFARNENDIGKCTVIKHKIELDPKVTSPVKKDRIKYEKHSKRNKLKYYKI